ncbi:restriction endonuclease subunit S [Mailhella massiliensis]|uniref:Restriction endonuclease subunit S n=1 Tax=Mailhella massiliensis TaxID=1903261 RepID=A0A921DRC5_9BACT|nr:restriction endonuclease subunit S [Mailhella massiliensis]HJD96876.1 restriction endonuclease subunit S [Mailhella massiliensis]
MIFDDQTLTAGYAFAAQLCEAYRELSARDLKLVMLAAMGEVSLPSARLEHIRLHIHPNWEGCNRILFVVATLCEIDRISGARQLPPTRVIDVMSHIQVFRENMPEGAVIECHGDSTLPLALWFAFRGAVVYFTGDKDFASCCAAIAEREIRCVSPEEPFVSEAYHFVSLFRGNVAIPAFYRKLFRARYKGAVILTTWSFLNCDSPRILQLKQKFVSSGELRTAIQLPSGVMNRALPALLQLAPPRDGNPGKVRLINAKDWFILGHAGIVEVSYLTPILDQVDRKPHAEGQQRGPMPPAEDVAPAELILRQCDLRMRDQQILNNTEHFERLEECATLIRGQVLPSRASHEIAHEYREVVLTDIDEFGLVASASRVLDNAPRLTPSREVALLRKNDILLSSKGSLLSLGRVGIVADTVPNWLPSQTFYLIRAEIVDPIWLFYFLRSRTAQEYFQSHSSGTTVPQIKVGDLSSLQIPVPDERQLEEVHRIHEDMLKLVKKKRKLREQQGLLLQQSQSVFDSML